MKFTLSTQCKWSASCANAIFDKFPLSFAFFTPMMRTFFYCFFFVVVRHVKPLTHIEHSFSETIVGLCSKNGRVCWLASFEKSIVYTHKIIAYSNGIETFGSLIIRPKIHWCWQACSTFRAKLVFTLRKFIFIVLLVCLSVRASLNICILKANSSENLFLDF